MNTLKARWQASTNPERIAWLKALDAVLFPETARETEEFIDSEYLRVIKQRGFAFRSDWLRDRRVGNSWISRSANDERPI